jgi:hypothetical protein
MAWSLWRSAPIQEPSKDHLIRAKDVPVIQEIPRNLRDLYQELRAEANGTSLRK